MSDDQETLHTLVETLLGLPDCHPADSQAVDGHDVGSPAVDGPAVDGPAVDGPAVDGPATEISRVEASGQQTEGRAVLEDAQRLAGVLGHLRDISALTPPTDQLARFRERVRLYQEGPSVAGEQFEQLPEPSPDPQSPTPLTDLFELCSDTLSDEEAGQVERELAQDPHKQRSLKDADRLVATLGWLRESTELQPSQNAAERFAQRVGETLDEEIRAASGSGEWVLDFSVSVERTDTDSSVAVMPVAHRLRRARRWTATRLLLAACILLGLGMAAWSVLQPPPGHHVLALAEKANSREDLQKLEEPLQELVGLSLVSLGSTDPKWLANIQLLLGVSSDPQADYRQLELARFLASQQRSDSSWPWSSLQARFSGTLPWEAPRVAQGTTGPASWQCRYAPWENVAHASSGVSSEAPLLDRQLRQAIRQGDYLLVEQLAASGDAPRYRLLQLWALVAASQANAARDLLVELKRNDFDRPDILPTSGRVYLAGLCRRLNLFEEAAQDFNDLSEQIPQLAFHLGYLYLYQLHDVEKANEQFQRLQQTAQAGDRLAVYGRFGSQAIPSQQPLTSEMTQADLDSWQMVIPHPQAQPLVAIDEKQAQDPTTGASERWFLWQTIADQLQAGELICGQPEWTSYQVTADVRFQPGNGLGRDPRMALLAYYQRHEHHYRVVLGLNSLKIQRRSVHPAGGFVTDRCGSVQPLTEPVQPGRVYRMKLLLQQTPEGVLLSAKVWPRSSAEPHAWMVQHLDLNPVATSGRVGFSAIDCLAGFTNFQVKTFTQSPLALRD